MRLFDLLSEDEVTDKFGKLAFGDSEYTAKLQGRVKPEPNTETEKELIHSLKSWIEKSGTLSADKIYSQRELLKKAAKKFPKILKPKTSNGTDLYRGLRNLQNKTMIQLQNSNQKEWSLHLTVHGLRWWKSNTLTIDYKPHKNIQSWTSDFWQASGFSKGIILSTLQNDEFFFNQELMWYLAPSEYEYEKEVLHLGKEYTNQIYIMINEAVYLDLFVPKPKGKSK